MKASKEELKKEVEMFKDLLSFRCKYYHPEDTDEFWSTVLDESEALHEKYNNMFLSQAILCCIHDIDERSPTVINGGHSKRKLLEMTMDRLLKVGVVE